MPPFLACTNSHGKFFFCVCEEQPECSRLETVIFFTSVKQEIIGAVNSH